MAGEQMQEAQKPAAQAGAKPEVQAKPMEGQAKPGMEGQPGSGGMGSKKWIWIAAGVAVLVLIIGAYFILS